MNRTIPTLKNIAKQLNISVSTVSRALNDHPRIGLRTKTAVQQLAKQLHYEPNSQAIFFKKKKTYVVGVVVPSVREEFFSQAISGIEAAATEHHYTILFGQSYDKLEKEKAVVDIMRKQRVDGLIISLSKETKTYDHLLAFDKVSIPVVYFDRVPPFQNANKVYCDIYNGTVEMVRWLVKNGYRRIALINGPEELCASKERIKGYIDGLAKKRLKADMKLVVKTDFSTEKTQEAIRYLLDLKTRPDAVISFNEYVHVDAVQFADLQGVKSNVDIAFVSYANLPITKYTAFPPVLSLEQFPNQQGAAAMDMMIRLLSVQNGEENIIFQSEELAPRLITMK